MKGVARLRPRGESGVAAGEAMAPSSKKHAGEGDAAMGAGEAEAVPGPKLQIQLPRKIGGPAAKGRSAPASSSQRAKGQGQGEIDILELLLVLLKMACQQGQMIRALSGTVWIAFLIPLKERYASEMLAAGTSYDEQVKEEGKGHALGAPPRAQMDGVRGRGNRGRSTQGRGAGCHAHAQSSSH